MAHFLHQRQCFHVLSIHRTNIESLEDGDIAAENCLIHIDDYNVLGVFNIEDATNNNWTPRLYFPLNNAESISFKRIKSAGGRHSMGRMVIKGVFSIPKEKITIKLDVNQYDELVAASRSWP